MKKKLVYIAPHLSTGGLPQYLFKQIESLLDEFEVYCIEWENVTGGVLVIQRNRILNILGDRLITVPENKHMLFDILHSIGPDIVHLQEIPELFMANDIADKLYSPSREYVLVETSHDSSYDVSNKRYLPDKFMLVSQYQINSYQSLDIPCELVEHPIEYKKKTKPREQALLELGLDPNLKHVINVGLFTPRKNQAEIIEYAKALKDYPIQFHFIGNQADNFKFYWEPLMKDLPPNCKWWNERNDVDSFYEAADLFLFTSRGHATDKETMPLVIREAIGWNVPSLIYNLPVYLNYFDKFKHIEYLTETPRDNSDKILHKLKLASVITEPVIHKECILITSYMKTKKSVDLTKQLIEDVRKFGLPIVLTSHTKIPSEIQEMVDYCLYDSKNILTSLSHINTVWHEHDSATATINLNTERNNVSYHGPAAYTCIYNGIAFANSLGFSLVHFFTYDLAPTNNSCITFAREALRTKKAVFHYMVEPENLLIRSDVHTLRTEWFAVDTSFFLEMFPVISSEKDYNDWYLMLGADSNGLENIYYHVLKEKVDKIQLLTTDDINTFFKNTFNSTSGRNTNFEASSILPIQGDDEHCIFYVSANFGEDARLIKIYVNDKLWTETLMSRSWYYDKFKLTDLKSIRTETWSPDESRLLSTKTFIIDEDYIKTNLKLNGIFTYKEHTPIPQETSNPYELDVHWNMEEQRAYYSCKKAIDFPVRISIKEHTSHAVMWSFVTENIAPNILFWAMPIPKHVQSFIDEWHFTGIRFCMYNERTGEKIFEQPLAHNPVDIPEVRLSEVAPYRINYVEFFIDKKYSKWVDKPHKTVVDVGANVGIFIEYMTRYKFADTVVGVECGVDALADLGRNFKNNPHVHIVPKALSHSEAPIVFYEFSKNSLVNTTIKPDKLVNHLVGLESDVTRTVETVTLSNLIDTYGTIDLMKIDIEGAEYEILEMADASVFANINSLLIECHYFEENAKEKSKKLVDKLVSLGYTLDGVPCQFDANYYDTIYAYKQ
jgi:FkbM family methyltransferase